MHVRGLFTEMLGDVYRLWTLSGPLLSVCGMTVFSHAELSSQAPLEPMCSSPQLGAFSRLRQGRDSSEASHLPGQPPPRPLPWLSPRCSQEREHQAGLKPCGGPALPPSLVPSRPGDSPHVALAWYLPPPAHPQMSLSQCHLPESVVSAWRGGTVLAISASSLCHSAQRWPRGWGEAPHIWAAKLSRYGRAVAGLRPWPRWGQRFLRPQL